MKMCEDCGCVMQETEEVCPNCGHKEEKSTQPKENHRNSINVPEPVQPKKSKKEEPVIQESPFPNKEVNPFEGLPLPVSKPEVKEPQIDPDIPLFRETPKLYERPPEPVHNTYKEPSKNNQSTKIILVAIVVIAIVAGCLGLVKVFTPSEKITPDDSSKIKLTEIEDSKNDEKPTKPEKPIEPEKPEEEPEQPTEEQPEKPSEVTEKQLGEFILSIPNTYTITSYQDGLGWTITDAKTGKTMTFIPGVYDIATYRSKKDEIVSQMEEGGTKVNRVYNTVIKNIDMQALELIEESVSYIMLIVPVNRTGKTILVMVADYSNPHSFNYDSINDALDIIGTIKEI